MARLALVAAGGLARVVLIDVRPDVDERHASKLHAVAANLCEKLPGTPVVFFHHSAAAAAAAALARAHACVAATTAVDAQIPGLEGFTGPVTTTLVILLDASARTLLQARDGRRRRDREKTGRRKARERR